MSWDVRKEEWVAAATSALIAEPASFPIDEFDAHLCGVLGVASRPSQGDAAPWQSAPEVPAEQNEPLEVGLQPAQAAPSGEHLDVAIEPAPAADFSAPLPTPPAPEDQDAVPEPVEASKSPLPEPPPFAVPASELPPDPTPVSGIGVDEPMQPAEDSAATGGAEELDEATPAESASGAETEPATKDPDPETGAANSSADAQSESQAQAESDPDPAPAEEGVPQAVPPGTEPQSGGVGVNEAVVSESGPIDVGSVPSLFMPPSLLRPIAEETHAEEPPPEEAEAVPEGIPREEEDSGEVVEALDAEDFEEELDSADLEEALSPAGEAAAAPPKPPPSPPASAARRRNWWDDVFTEHYSTISVRGVEESAERDVEFVLSCTETPEGASVLDVGCGIGHHALKFAERGYQVTGVDSSLAQLLRASELNEEREAGISFMHGDMRELPTEQLYDLVTCLGTTIGYFEEDVNRQVLEEMHDRLAPGGRLMLQVFNRDYLVSKLPIRSWWQGNKCLVLDEAELNYKANRLRIHRTVVFEDGRQFEHYMFMRAYSVHDLGKALSSAGLKVLQLSGSRETRGRFYGSASPDIWIVARRRDE